jgi:hypothetical protein
MEHEKAVPTRAVSRRTALRMLASGSVIALMSACGAPAPTASPTTAPAPSNQKPGAPSTATTAAASATGSGATLNVTFADLGTENMAVIGSVTNQFISLIYEPCTEH